MTDESPERDLIEAATAGDQVAMQKLLAPHTSALVRFVEGRLPKSSRDLVEADDLVQQTLIEAYRAIPKFRGQDRNSFQAWLFGIAENKIMDTVKWLKRVKRGGEYQRVRDAPNEATRSVADLVALLSAGMHTPSVSVAKHEAIHAVQQVIDQLPEDQQNAVRMRLFEGKSLEETGKLMDRGPRPHGLRCRSQFRKSNLELIGNEFGIVIHVGGEQFPSFQRFESTDGGTAISV